MLAIIGQVLTILIPIILKIIGIAFKNQAAKEKAIKSFYEFIAQIDKKSATKVLNYINAETALEKLQREIREKQLEEPSREAFSSSTKMYDMPKIVTIDVAVKTHGKYLTKSKHSKGLVIHYTMGQFKDRQNAANTLNDLAARGLGCMVMDQDGTIYRARNQALDDIAWHAGKSGWLGESGISRYCMGLEICCAGKLRNHEKKFHPWWHFGKDGFFKKGSVPISLKKVSIISETTKNQRPGAYHVFTAKQEESLINFCLWQLDVNPEFDIDWIVGHDEISILRKSDPGGSLSMTMPDFRAMIKKMVF